jgi:hypothetical protein
MGGRGQLLPFPGPAAQLQQRGQRQGAVSAQQQLACPSPENAIDQCDGGRFVRAQRVREPAAGDAAVPSAPMVRVPGVVDPHHQVWLQLRVRPLIPAGQDAGHRIQYSLVLGQIGPQRVDIAERAPPPSGDDRQQHPVRRRVAHHYVRLGGSRILQQRMAAIRLDDHDPARPASFGQPLQQRHGQRVQPGEDGGVLDEPRPQPRERLPPQHGYRHQRPDQRRPQADDLRELQGQRRLPGTGAGRVSSRRVAGEQAEHPGHHRRSGFPAPARRQGRRAQRRPHGHHGHDGN